MRSAQRPNMRLLILLLLLALLLVPVGCGASTVIPLGPVAWLTIGGIAVTALVMTARSAAPIPPQEIKTIGPDTPDAEVMALIKAHIFDLERWENEGGALDRRD
jgi:hypothetical protein